MLVIASLYLGSKCIDKSNIWIAYWNFAKLSRINSNLKIIYLLLDCKANWNNGYYLIIKQKLSIISFYLDRLPNIKPILNI